MRCNASASWVAVGLVVALLAPLTMAGKGGKGKPGGGGGDGGGGIADADVSILYSSGSGTVMKGDDAGDVEEAIDLQTYGAASFGPAGTTDIAFVAGVNGRGIYTSDFSGGSLTKVVSTAVHGHTAPTWSNGNAPNGEEMIAYVDLDATTGRYVLFVTTLDGETTQLNSGREVRHPSWNPATNDQIVVAGKTESLWLLEIDTDANGELYVADYADLTVGTALAGERIGAPTFSADGGTIVFSAAEGTGASDVWAYDLATGSLDNLTDGAMGGSDAASPCIRDDGKVMFSSPYKNRNAVLWVTDADGANIHRYNASKPSHDQYHVAARR